MNGPAVVVNKGGFLSSLVKGVFGTVMVVVVCGTALGLYGIYVLDKNVGGFVSAIASSLPEWQQAMPPVIADALNDERALDYRRLVEVRARVVRGGKEPDGEGLLEIVAVNNGDRVVSLLSLRVLVEDESEEHALSLAVMAATPLALEGDWIGPLAPDGAVRKIVRPLRHIVGKPEVTVEVTDLRVWKGPLHNAPAAAEGPAVPLPSSL